MIPAQINIPCWANSDYLEEFPVTDNGVAVDLTDVTPSMQVRAYPNGPIVLTPTIFVSDGNVINISISRAQLSDALTYGQFLIYDIVMSHVDSIDEIYAQGILYISQGVTQNG